MKKAIALLALIASVSALGSENCIIRTEMALTTTDGDIVNRPFNNSTRVFRAANWESCYNEAIAVAKKNPIRATGYLNVLFRIQLVEGPVFISWEYNDGIVDMLNTSGWVSAFTPQFQPVPQDGDQRYYANGDRFEY